MIVQFPSPYADELVYSLFARFFARSGYLAYRFAAEDLFENPLTKPSIEFVDRLTPAAYRALERIGSWEYVVMRHTMFKYYSIFLPLQRRKAAYDAIMEHDSKYHDYLCIPKSNDCTTRYLRYCPLCSADDRQHYGETYWHRLHQMHGITICPIHFCFLENSTIAISSNGTPALIAAEDSIPAHVEAIFSANSLECRLASYVATVFTAEFDPTAIMSLHNHLHAALKGTKYISEQRQTLNAAKLYVDYTRFYAAYPSLPLNQQWQIQKIFSGQRYNMLEVCSIAMFLGIPPSKLSHPVCHTVNTEQMFQSQPRKKPNRGNTHKKDWERIDAETLPFVKNLLTQLAAETDAKPIRITLGLVQRKLNLSSKKLDKCPLCKEVIELYATSQEEHWRHLLEWATQKLHQENKPVHMTNLMKLTNLRKANISSVLATGCSDIRDNPSF